MKRLLITGAVLAMSAPATPVGASPAARCTMIYRDYPTFAVEMVGVPGAITHVHHKNGYWAIGRPEGPRVIIDPVYAPETWEAKCNPPADPHAHKIGKLGLRKRAFDVCLLSTLNHLEIAEVWVTRADIAATHVVPKPRGIHIEFRDGGAVSITPIKGGVEYTKIVCPGGVSKP